MKVGSCNGCRILRKGCREDCIIRTCIEWIDCPESQANATLFLAKYYGRAGLVNLINAGCESQRISLFKSLLYEACGRILNPVYGSLGLLRSGNWYHCEAAVRSVLRGSFTANKDSTLSIARCGIRHACKNKNILSINKSRGNKAPMRSKRPISEIDRRACSSAEDSETLEKVKVGDFWRNLNRRENKSKKTVELESSLCPPSMPDSASPANRNDQFDTSLKLSL